MIGLLILSSLVGLAAPILLGFFAQQTLARIFESPCRRSERCWGLLFSVIFAPLWLGWVALVPLQWFAFFSGKGVIETLAPLGLSALGLAIALPMLPRALRQRRITLRFAELERASGLRMRFRYPALIQRWMQGEHLGHAVAAVPVDPVTSLTDWLRRRVQRDSEQFDFGYARRAGVVVMARTQARQASSLELVCARDLERVNLTRVFVRPLPSSLQRIESGQSDFDRNVYVVGGDADRAAARRLVSSIEVRTQLVHVFAAHPLLYARAGSGAGAASLQGGKVLEAPLDRPGFFVVEWIPMPRTVAEILAALDVVVRVARILDAVAVGGAPTSA